MPFICPRSFHLKSRVSNLRFRIACSLAILFLVLTSPSFAADPIEADFCVYGGTSGGVTAAVQAARMGKRAIILEPGRHLGGMTASGLSAVDIGEPRSVGGIAREYFTRLAATTGKTLNWDRGFEGKGGPATGGAFAIEPHQAERLFVEMLRDVKVPVHYNARLAKVRKDGPRIVELEMEDGAVFRARMFLDATYEGDLMARAGVSYTVAREGNAKYGEQQNGIHYTDSYKPRTNHAKPGPNGRTPSGQGVWDRDLPLDPYVVAGDPKSGLLPLLQAGEPGTPGDPAPGVQAYCYRLCLTTAVDRRPIEPPQDYDPKRYELVARFIAGCQALGDDIDLRWFSKYDPLPNQKWDFNTATFGGNLPGASWAWPDASYAEREKIAQQHEDYHRGLLHFLATDPRVPVKVRQEMRRFGLPRDEFADYGGWPHQIYVREARRMVSDLVLTEHHTFGRKTAANSIGLGSYGTDTHEIRRIAVEGVVIREGKTAGGRGGFGPYAIGYGAIVPKASECQNLLVTFALSASHTAFSSLRMEPVFMVTSQSAATAACLAIDAGKSVQEVDTEQLRARLLADGQVLAWTADKQKAAVPPTSPMKVEKKVKLTWTKLPAIPDKIGFAGSFAGIASDTLLVAGGANFPGKLPFKGANPKVWYDGVFALTKPEGPWIAAGQLPAPRGYGVSVSTPEGLLLIGGSQAQGHLAEVVQLTWKEGKLGVVLHSQLPYPLANACGALVGDTLYIAGGIQTPDANEAMHTFLALDLKAKEKTWRKIDAWPGSGRMLSVAASHDGAFYLFGGAALHVGPNGSPVREWLNDAYRYHPQDGWKKLADAPRVAVAAPSPAPIVEGRILILGGDDGAQVNVPNNEHRGFPRDVLAYDPARNRWERAGEMLFSHVTTSTAIWQKRIVIPGGEIMPGVRSTEVWGAEIKP